MEFECDQVCILVECILVECVLIDRDNSFIVTGSLLLYILVSELQESMSFGAASTSNGWRLHRRSGLSGGDGPLASPL